MMADIPAFDPSKPFEEGEVSSTSNSSNIPTFDPSKAFSIPQPEHVIPGTAALSGYTNQAASGIPGVSPILDRATAATGALFGAGAAPTFSERYSNELKRVQGSEDQFAKEHPIGQVEHLLHAELLLWLDLILLIKLF
jgi:hypothetical protein